MPCPIDFEVGLTGSCHMRCPTDFNYVQTGREEKCIHSITPAYTIPVVSLPELKNSDKESEPEPEPEQYIQERRRFRDEFESILVAIRRDDDARKAMDDVKSENSGYVTKYNRIQSEYASVNAAIDSENEIKKVSDSLKTLRSKTQPVSDMERERRAILDTSSRNILLVQIALFILVLSLLSYLIIPANYAHMVVFLLLCVGIATGIFLGR